MNVLLLTPLFPPDTGGSATAFELLSRHLFDDPSVGKVVILCETSGVFPKWERIHGKGLLMRFLPRLGRVDRYDRRSAIFKMVLIIRRSLALLLLLPLLSRLFRADVIHFHSTFGHVHGKYRNHIVELALKLSRGRKICDVQDRRGKALHRRLADAFIANSMKIYRELRGFRGMNGTRVEYLPVPIQTLPRRRGEPLRVSPAGGGLPQPFFSFVGDLTGPKGIYPLLEAHKALLRSRSYPLTLVLVGRDRTGGRLTCFLDERTLWLGVLPHEETLSVIGLSRFLILPSFSEGIPRVCLEALAIGTPILYPPGIEEFHHHLPGYMLPEITAESIQLMIRKMLSGEHRQRYPLHQHDASVHYQRIRAIYREMISRPA